MGYILMISGQYYNRVAIVVKQTYVAVTNCSSKGLRERLTRRNFLLSPERIIIGSADE